MAFSDLIRQRFSSRKYTDKKVEEEKLQTILEAGRVAPTACNKQPFKLLVIQSESGLEKLKKAYKTFDAPLAILVCADLDECWERPADGKQSGDIDASIITDHMMLQATELGLGTVWVCNFNPEIMAQKFNIPEHLDPVNLLIIGYSAEEKPSPRHTQRKNLDELVTII